MSKSSNEPVRSRIAGAWFGLAFGDFLGRPVDQRSKKQIRAEYAAFAKANWPNYWTGADNTAIGLSMACVQAYKTKTFTLEAAADAMCGWAKSFSGDIGGLTRRALELLDTGRVSPQHSGRLAWESGYDGEGAGSLMRAAATGLTRRASDAALVSEAQQMCRITHVQVCCVEACVAFCVVLSSLIDDPTDVDRALVEAHQRVDPHGEVAQLLRGVMGFQAPRHQRAFPGFVLLNLERALIAVRDAQSFEQGLLQVVEQRGDSDTAGSIAGALLGTRFGIQEVPHRWASAAGIDERLESAVDACVNFRVKRAPRRKTTSRSARVLTLSEITRKPSQARKLFDEQGFLVVEKMVPPAFAREARERFAAIFSGQFETGILPDDVRWREGLGATDVTREIRNAWRADRLIAQIALDSTIGRLCALFAGWKSTRVNQAGALWKPPGARGVGFHQDESYLNWFLPTGVVTCWVALDDVSAASGPLEYARGSHRLGLLTRLEQFDSPSDPYEELRRKHRIEREDLDVEQVIVPAGGAAFHDGLLLHGSGPNTSKTPRRAIAIHTMNGQAQFHPTEYARTYSRYRRLDSLQMDENVFPIIWGKRTRGIERFLKRDDQSPRTKAQNDRR